MFVRINMRGNDLDHHEQNIFCLIKSFVFHIERQLFVHYLSSRTCFHKWKICFVRNISQNYRIKMILPDSFNFYNNKIINNKQSIIKLKPFLYKTIYILCNTLVWNSFPDTIYIKIHMTVLKTSNQMWGYSQNHKRITI